jgi:hypothetical protein
MAESGALYFTSLHLREGCARFTLSQHIRPMITNHDLFHFRGHVMLQWRKSSHFEAFIVRIYAYIGHEVENETSKLQIFCEENLWPRYDAYIILAALYASICYTVCLP